MTKALRLVKFAVSVMCILALAEQARAQHLSPLAEAPDWSKLDAYQETVTHDEFVNLLTTVYAPRGAADQTIHVTPDSAVIEETASSGQSFTLRFAPTAEKARRAPRYWRPAAAMDPPSPKSEPLEGMKVALDPGHLGGTWAKMEARWFQIGESPPVTEGDMVLVVAKHLARRLRELGADVYFVRRTPGPTTATRPEDLRDAARVELKRQGIQFVREKYDGPNDPLKENSVQWESELLFYRTDEIRHRARIVNGRIKPDVTLCLHFNAEAWGDPAKPSLTDHNHVHLIVNGCYSAAELALDDIRFDMLRKLLSRAYAEEVAASDKVAQSLAKATGLPPYEYTSDNAIRAGSNPYLWARNLLANRLYRCPVLYIEPYVMNSQPVFDRVQMGDYEGERNVNGQMRKSIYREYADAVAAGLADYYSEARGKSAK